MPASCLSHIPVEVLYVAADHHDHARDTVRAYRDLGFDRLLFYPAVAELDQVDLLADAVL